MDRLLQNLSTQVNPEEWQRKAPMVREASLTCRWWALKYGQEPTEENLAIYKALKQDFITEVRVAVNRCALKSRSRDARLTRGSFTIPLRPGLNTFPPPVLLSAPGSSPTSQQQTPKAPSRKKASDPSRRRPSNRLKPQPPARA